MPKWSTAATPPTEVLTIKAAAIRHARWKWDASVSVIVWSRFIFSSLLKTIFFLIVWSILIFRLCYGCGRYLLQHFNLLALCFVLVFIWIFFMASKTDKIMKEIMPNGISFRRIYNWLPIVTRSINGSYKLCWIVNGDQVGYAELG